MLGGAWTLPRLWCDLPASAATHPAQPLAFPITACFSLGAQRRSRRAPGQGWAVGSSRCCGCLLRSRAHAALPCPPTTPPSARLDGNTAVHHNPPSVASSPVADNLPVVHACALSWCLRPGWRGGRSPRLIPLNPMGMLPGRGCHRAKRLGRSRHRGQCWCDA